MYYVIMDLEWNNAYSKSAQKFVNEIIEIGAVKLDENLNTVSTYSEIVRPVLSRKLRSRIKNLTHITNEEVSSGKPFSAVMTNFEKWAGEDCLFLTWGDTDIRTLLSNYKSFMSKDSIDFIKKYADLQKYCQCFINMENVQQAGLSYAAGCLGIDPEKYPHHRALDDSVLSAECFKKTFDSKKINGFIKICDKDFYARLAFQPYIVSNINDPIIDKKMFNCRCVICGDDVKAVKNWKFSNQTFRGVFFCSKCDRQFTVTLKIKRFYDYLDIKRNYSEVIPLSGLQEKN